MCRIKDLYIKAPNKDYIRANKNVKIVKKNFYELGCWQFPPSMFEKYLFFYSVAFPIQNVESKYRCMMTDSADDITASCPNILFRVQIHVILISY